MSKKNGTQAAEAATEEKALALVDFNPINDVPDKAPAPQMDLSNPNLSYDDVLPSNYFSMEELELWLEERSAESRILTITGCSVEFVYDPEKGEATGDWKPCLSFAETATMLVINKTRGMQLKKLTGSPFLKEWAKAGQIAIKPGIGNGKAQIIITAAKKEFTGEEIDEMFSYG